MGIPDQAGKTELGPFDFKGNLNESRRTLAQSYTTVIDWNVTGVELGDEDDPAAAESAVASASLLEAEEWPEAREYDALNRVVSLTTPDDSVYLPTFNEAGLLETVQVQVRGDSTETFVRNVEYDAKGRRTKIEYGDASTKVTTQYAYDALTFRLTRLWTTRASDSADGRDAGDDEIARGERPNEGERLLHDLDVAEPTGGARDVREDRRARSRARRDAGKWRPPPLEP